MHKPPVPNFSVSPEGCNPKRHSTEADDRRADAWFAGKEALGARSGAVAVAPATFVEAIPPDILKRMSDAAEQSLFWLEQVRPRIGARLDRHYPEADPWRVLLANYSRKR